MDLLLENPIVWIGIGIFVLVLIIVISVLVGKKRSREVEELDQMFSEGHLSGEDLGKISVEKVRKNALERERRKKELQHLAPVRERPKKGEKVLPDEDKEIIITPNLSDSRPNRSVTKDAESDIVKGGRKRQAPSIQSDMEKDEQRQRAIPEEPVSSERRPSPTSFEAKVEEADPNTDPLTSRHLYKKSLLSPERVDGAEEGEASPSQSSQTEVRESRSSSGTQENEMGNQKVGAGLPRRTGGLPKRTSRSSGDASGQTARPRELPSRSKRRLPGKDPFGR